MSVSTAKFERLRLVGNRIYRVAERETLKLTIIISITIYTIRYFHYKATPGNSPLVHPMGWWGWFDQGKYLQSIDAFYSGNLDPSNHFYPPLYPLVGVIGRVLSSGHPYFLVNMALYCIYSLCFIRVANQYFSKCTSLVIWVSVSVGFIHLIDLFVIPWTTSLQSCFISVSLVYILRISNPNELRRKYPRIEAASAGAIIGLLISNRPGDIPISLFLLGFCAFKITFQNDKCDYPEKIKQVVLMISAWTFVLLVFLSINQVIYGSILGSYIKTAGANGYFPSEFLNKFVSLFLDSQSLFLEKRLSIVDVMPWMALAIVGSIGFLIIGKGVLRIAVIVSSLYFALFVPYGDLLPNGMWRYLNFHYFAWTVPYFLLASFAFLKQINGTRYVLKQVTVLVSISLIGLLFSVGFATNYSDIDYFRINDGISTIQFSQKESINYIDFPDLKSDFQTAYFGNNVVVVDGIQQTMVRDFRLIASNGIVRLLFQKRIEASRIQISFDKNIEFRGSRFRVGRVDLALVKRGRSNLEFPVQLNSEVTFNEGGMGPIYLKEGWSMSEKFGTWSNSKRAYLRIPIEPSDLGAFKVTIKYVVFLPQNHCQLVQGMLKKEVLFQQRYCSNSGSDIRTNSFWIEKDSLNEDEELLLEFKLPDAISPLEAGLSDDTRTLSIGLLSMKVDASSE
jgi:hypothetical protein